MRLLSLARHAAAPALIAFLAAGCHIFDGPAEEDDATDTFSHRPSTAYAVIPSRDGKRVLLLLEPRRVDAISRGVMISGWRGKVAGDAVVRVGVGDDAGRVIATIPGGRHEGDYDEAFGYVFTSELRDWPLDVPFGDTPVATGFTKLTVVDRTTLAVTREVPLDPPLEKPYAWRRGKLIDGPGDGESDVARSMDLTVFDVESGDRTPIYQARGFASQRATCGPLSVLAHRSDDRVRGTVLVIAREDGVSTLDIPDLRPTEIVCRASGSGVAIVGTRDDGRAPRLVLVDTARADELAIVRDLAATSPAALSADGRVLFATHDGHGFIANAQGEVQELAQVTATGRAAVSAERALVTSSTGGWIVRLDGRAPTVLPVDRPTATVAKRAGYPLAGGRFAFFDTEDGPGDDATLTQAFTMEADGQARSLEMPKELAYPRIAFSEGEHAVVVASRLSSPKSVAFDVLALEAATGATTTTLRDAFCDWRTIQMSDRCLP
ncbi:MAG: hypothetical protein U0235_10560 [Polyangiaceae bacterium]